LFHTVGHTLAQVGLCLAGPVLSFTEAFLVSCNVIAEALLSILHSLAIFSGAVLEFFPLAVQILSRFVLAVSLGFAGAVLGFLDAILIFSRAILRFFAATSHGLTSTLLVLGCFVLAIALSFASPFLGLFGAILIGGYSGAVAFFALSCSFLGLGSLTGAFRRDVAVHSSILGAFGIVIGAFLRGFDTSSLTALGSFLLSGMLTNGLLLLSDLPGLIGLRRRSLSR